MQNWRTEVTGVDYLQHQKKQAQIENRRPVIRKASDLVGPGIDAHAIRLTDFNDTLATFNGFFSADISAYNAPNSTDAFVGFVSSDASLGGIQQFTSLATGKVWYRVFTRSPADATAVSWGTWKSLTPA